MPSPYPLPNGERVFDTKHLLGELRIDLGQHRRDDGAHEAQRFRRRRRRDRHGGGPVEVEAGVLDHLLDAVPGMDAGEAKAAALPIEIEQAAAGHQRDRAAGPKYVGGAAARRADEIDFRHQGAARVLDAEQDHLRHHVIEVGRPERAGKARLRPVVIADADQIDVAFAVDLAAGEKEDVDPALPGAVE